MFNWVCVGNDCVFSFSYIRNNNREVTAFWERTSTVKNVGQMSDEKREQ